MTQQKHTAHGRTSLAPTAVHAHQVRRSRVAAARRRNQRRQRAASMLTSPATLHPPVAMTSTTTGRVIPSAIVPWLLTRALAAAALAGIAWLASWLVSWLLHPLQALPHWRLRSAPTPLVRQSVRGRYALAHVAIGLRVRPGQ